MFSRQDGKRFQKKKKRFGKMEYLFSWLGGRGKKFKFNLRSLNFMLQKTERFKEQIDVVELKRRIILASEF